MKIPWLKINTSDSLFFFGKLQFFEQCCNSEPSSWTNRSPKQQNYVDFKVLRLIYFLIQERKALTLFSLLEISLTGYCQLRFVSVFTSRYLTLLVGYSLLPHNLIYKSPSSFFCLDLKITISVFFTLSGTLFEFNQLTRCFRSALTSFFSFLIELLKHKRLVSSAKQ